MCDSHTRAVREGDVMRYIYAGCQRGLCVCAGEPHMLCGDHMLHHLPHTCYTTCLPHVTPLAFHMLDQPRNMSTKRYMREDGCSAPRMRDARFKRYVCGCIPVAYCVVVPLYVTPHASHMPHTCMWVHTCGILRGGAQEGFQLVVFDINGVLRAIGAMEAADAAYCFAGGARDTH